MGRKLSVMSLSLVLGRLAAKFNLGSVEVYYDGGRPCKVTIYYGGLREAEIVVYDDSVCRLLD